MPFGNYSSEVSDADLEGFAENELEKLQRTCRIMEGDRQAYALESQDLIRRQLAEIENLRSERNDLVKNLNLAESKFNQDKDKSNTNDLQRLLDEKDACEQEILEEKEVQKALDEEIKIWEKKVSDQRVSMGGSQATSSFSQRTQKRMSVLEGRLDRALSRYNMGLTKNATLRDHIQTLRIEKNRFQALYKKLEKELKDLKREIAQVIEASTLAYDQRDESQNKILLLRDKSEKDLQQFNGEIKELQRIIDHDKALRNFMNVKGITRNSGENLGQQGKHTKRRGDGRQSIESFEIAFREIEEITSESDMDVLVERFIQVEDSNFALFNYVNEQNNEIERIRDAIEQILQNIAEFKSEENRLEEDHKAILSDLEESTSNAVQAKLYSKQRLKSTMKILEQLKQGISSLFEKIGCDGQLLNDMLGSEDGVKNDNVMQYLGLVEQKANELLAAQAYIDSQDLDRPYNPQEHARIMLGQAPTTPIQPILISPPSTGFRDSENEEQDGLTDEDSRPLTQDELKMKIMKRVAKKEASATRRGFAYDLSAAKKK